VCVFNHTCMHILCEELHAYLVHKEELVILEVFYRWAVSFLVALLLDVLNSLIQMMKSDVKCFFYLC